MNSSKRPWIGIVFVLISGSCWGFHGILIKYALGLGASFLQVFLVEAILATLFFGLFAKSFFRHAKPEGLKQWLSLLAIGLATVGVGYFLFLSYSLGPVAIPATLMFMYLPVVYCISVFSGHQKVSVGKVIAILFVIVGAVLTTRILSTFGEPGTVPAVWAALAASMSYAVIFVLTPTIASFTSLEFRSFTVSGIGLIGCALIAISVPSLWHDLGDNWVPFLLFALILGVFGQILPVITLMKGLPLTGGSLGGVLASVELPIAVFSSVLLLGEPLGPGKILGVVLVIFGIVLYNYMENLNRVIVSRVKEIKA